jgi:hypothetical protein
MNNSMQSIIAAIKILRQENPESKAIELLEDSLKQSMKFYIMDMASIGTVIKIEEVEEELRNGLKLLGIINRG